MIAQLARAVTGPDGDAEIPEPREDLRRFRRPTRLLTPTAVTDIAAALDRIRLDSLLSELPTSTEGIRRVPLRGRVGRGERRSAAAVEVLGRHAGELPGQLH
ncbi:hypothetical protein [Streptomyces sp. cg40]|uniref:hypothetical protein n=1 Tax=Streptomyces sp. cg40 TaxID=3419764 RepID=UPI003D07755C